MRSARRYSSVIPTSFQRDPKWKRCPTLCRRYPDVDFANVGHAGVSIDDNVKEILRYEMKKIREITCSNWASQRLTIEQIEYAAMDAWVTLRLYQTLRRP